MVNGVKIALRCVLWIATLAAGTAATAEPAPTPRVRCYSSPPQASVAIDASARSGESSLHFRRAAGEDELDQIMITSGRRRLRADVLCDNDPHRQTCQLMTDAGVFQVEFRDGSARLLTHGRFQVLRDDGGRAHLGLTRGREVLIHDLIARTPQDCDRLFPDVTRLHLPEAHPYDGKPATTPDPKGAARGGGSARPVPADASK